MATPSKSWQRTRVQGMYRHANGNYYARTFGGKAEKWHSHRTDDYSTAKRKHEEYMRGIREQRAVAGSVDSAKMTWGEAEAIFLARLDADPKAKASTRHYKRQVIASLKRDWPDLQKTMLRTIGRQDVQAWAAKHGKRASSTRYNAALGILRAILAIGVDSFALAANPAIGLKRHKVKPERPELPTWAQFAEVLKTMREAKGRFSKAAADFIEGLSLTGLRLNEAASLQWSDVKEDAIRVTGGEKGTKSGEHRTVYLQPKAVKFFNELPKRGAKVFQVMEAQKSLDRATKIVGCPRITHHDLRHYYCTLCIEEGVPIPTIARWLGHQDGGALLMRVYGQLRDEHSRAMAKMIDFAPKESSPPPKQEP